MHIDIAGCDEYEMTNEFEDERRWQNVNLILLVVAAVTAGMAIGLICSKFSNLAIPPAAFSIVFALSVGLRLAYRRWRERKRRGFR